MPLFITLRDGFSNIIILISREPNRSARMSQMLPYKIRGSLGDIPLYSKTAFKYAPCGLGSKSSVQIGKGSGGSGLE